MESNRPLAPLTWLRVGGPAERFFMPKDLEDLCATLSGLAPEIPVFPLGLGSNLIIRDGGIRGLVIRLGRGFNGMEFSGDRAVLGAAVPDAQAAKRAAMAGLDLTFLRTIPGSIGGAARMNAGCYGSYLADHFLEAQAVTRQGEVVTLLPQDMGFAYRHTDLPPDLVITRVTLAAAPGDPEALAAKMEEQLARRDASQPTRDRTAGSTFRNPAGFSSTGRADDTHELKAWSLIDAAGMRGARLGGAQMSPMHSNFLVNAEGATAADLEGLGELVRKKVWDFHGIELIWEVQRVGDPLSVHPELTKD
ncbi:UDP-N-acetylmuramate dehydrogenase [Mangrovicoccus algicola]|uniref:UDP-N-acetylenolpyruvoylglucosamine reductase n=1 Tax=Mangrovicoccus algicola TaxID=2771008 RepID=A0A8J6YVS4_9RHOB|nr:UDP-N-acetylmuramate dehydrogenase [Mangrovicoccus algicola]MBE3637114.1 UDP-N-acetylmuramate dehydrogenase [Mangrovicoccus algicola]